MGRRTNGHFSKEERQMANSNMKILSITNHQRDTIKTTGRYCFTLVRMTVTRKNTAHVGEDVEERECKAMQPLVKTIWGFLKKLKIKLPHDLVFPPLSIYPKKPH